MCDRRKNGDEMASQAADPASTINIHNPGMVVLGNEAHINTTTSAAPLATCPLQRGGTQTWNAAPLATCPLQRAGTQTWNEHDAGLSVVEKVSANLRRIYQEKYGMIKQYPWEAQKKPLEVFFSAIDLKRENYGCEKQSDDLMYHIFDGCRGSPNPRHIFLYGSSGIGKTTLCQKYVNDWARLHNSGCTRNSLLDHFKVVLFLNNCEVKGTLEEIMKEQVPNFENFSPEEKTQYFSYMTNHPEKFLLIVDGINECNASELPGIMNFLQLMAHNRVHVIATSRPEHTDDWMKLYHHFHAHYCVKGYNDVSVGKFIETYLEDDKTKLEELNKEIKANTNLKHLAKIPLLTPIICELWKQLPSLPTMTEVLNNFVRVVSRLFYSRENFHWDDSMNSPNTLPSDIEDCLERLGKLALDGVEKNSMRYSKAKLREFGVKPPCKLGLLNALPELSNAINYTGLHCFPHKSIQEFLAARWLVKNWTSPESKRVIAMMLRDQKIAKFHHVLVFIAGLLSVNQPADHTVLFEFVKQLSTSTLNDNFLEEGWYGDRMQLVLECCYEMWQEIENPPIANVIKQLTESKVAGKIMFTKSITTGGFPLCMSFPEVQGLSLLVPLLRLTTLNLSGILIQAREAQMLATECLQRKNSLTTVKFANCCLCPDSVEAICKALTSVRNLKEVDMSWCNLSDKGLKALADLLEEANGMKILRLGDSCDAKHVEQARSPTPEQPSGVLSQIKHLYAFQEQLQSSPCGDDAILRLIKVVEEDCELEEISLLNYHIGNHIKEWLNALEKMEDGNSLKKIRLHFKQLDESVCRCLDEFAERMTSLHRIRITMMDETSTGQNTNYMFKSKKIEVVRTNHTHSIRSWAQVFGWG